MQTSMTIRFLGFVFFCPLGQDKYSDQKLHCQVLYKSLVFFVSKCVNAKKAPHL